MSIVNVQLEVGGPITQMQERDLVKRTGVVDNEVEHTTWVEYRLASQPDAERAIHRSVDIVLKQPAVFAEATAGQFC